MAAGLAAIGIGAPPETMSVPSAMDVVPVVTRAPQGPVICAVDCTLEALSWMSLGSSAPTTSISTVAVVALDEADSTPGRPDCALTARRPVLRICPVNPFVTTTDARLSLAL